MDRLFLTPLSKQNLKLSRSCHFEKEHFQEKPERNFFFKPGKSPDTTKTTANNKSGSDRDITAMEYLNFPPQQQHQQNVVVPQGRSRSVCLVMTNQQQGSLEEQDLLSFNLQKQIIKAKAEARTVSELNGDLYIDYKFIARLPPGVTV